jgi:hypothetical protein
MSAAERFAMIFHAAAEGVMARYRPGALQFGCSYREADRTRDEAMSGAFRAIGDVFAKIAEAERPSTVSLPSNAIRYPTIGLEGETAE